MNKEIASGGMGVVYEVEDRSTGELLALKRVRADAVLESHAISAFEREYQVLAGIEHPRIIRVFDYDIDETGPYYTMELLEGEDMRQAAPLPYRTACSLLRDVATSLSLLHARRLIHRDLSPANVRQTADGHCKLLDFGALSSFGTARTIVGTPPAVPPEAVAGEPLDQRADLYALGALAYFMLAGRHAYPAKEIEELPSLWKQPPAPLSEVGWDIPEELDELVLSLLSHDPLARPASAAEVIARLGVIGKLSPEKESDAELLAQSFLLSPRFVGRNLELAELEVRIADTVKGRGSAVLVSAAAGMGRTRLLEEVAVRGRIAGATVISVDASASRHARGTTRTLALRLLDALPDTAREAAKHHRTGLGTLGAEIEARLPSGTTLRPSFLELGADTGSSVEGWFVEVSRAKPLVITVDDVEEADAASLGLLAALARASATCPLLLVAAQRVGADAQAVTSLETLRGQCTHIQLGGLDEADVLELTRSLFGDAPNVGRLAEWLHGRTAGSPLFCMELARRLVEKQIIRYLAGMWILPTERPDAELPAGLGDALGLRLGLLSQNARTLAECLSLQRENPTLELCLEVLDEFDERDVLRLVDELARNGVLHAEETEYRFSSAALREALLVALDDDQRDACHRRLGEAFARLADNEPARRIDAGFHLMKGGHDVRGADMIAHVAADSVALRTLFANLHAAAQPIEDALVVYKRHRRSVLERAPLLSALAQAGYYEKRAWGERYGDEALDSVEDLSGLRLANRLRPWLGRALGLIAGIVVALVRFSFVPKRERYYSFRDLMVQLMGVVTTLTGAAAATFDVDRAARLAGVLEPFSFLPKRLTPVGIYEFCLGLQEIGRENQASATATFEKLLTRFENPKYYPTLPPDARLLYITGAHFARGAFAVFRSDGTPALESADALDSSGLKLYQMIASQLRFLYYMNRGELALAAAHRELVDLHAAQVGSAWQVETWEPAALIPVYTNALDVVGLARVADRLETRSKTTPSLKFYAHLARNASRLAGGGANEEYAKATLGLADQRSPRSFIGWATTYGFVAQGLSAAGQHAAAKEVCERALAQVTEADRAFVVLFIALDIQLAVAEAGLGQADAAFARLDRLLDRYAESEHPLALGLIHEARARIAWAQGRRDDYAHSLEQMDRWFRPTGTPGLIAKCERVAELSGAPAAARRAEGAQISSRVATLQRTGATSTSRTGADAMTVRTGPIKGAGD